MKTIRCALCGGEMKIVKINRFNRPHGIALMTAGVVFLALIPIEAVLGYALLPFGAVVAFSKKEAWHCQECAAYVDRVDPSKPKPLTRLSHTLASLRKAVSVDSETNDG